MMIYMKAKKALRKAEELYPTEQIHIRLTKKQFKFLKKIKKESNISAAHFIRTLLDEAIAEKEIEGEDDGKRNSRTNK